MAAVAIRGIAGGLTLTQSDFFTFFKGKFQRTKISAFVRAVAAFLAFWPSSNRTCSSPTGLLGTAAPGCATTWPAALMHNGGAACACPPLSAEPTDAFASAISSARICCWKASVSAFVVAMICSMFCAAVGSRFAPLLALRLHVGEPRLEVNAG